eukprot:CAMPEP_0172365180 /NCGR_PEP_ID=MMETSP1060-20121228/8138_1 /TAXON_ID=37318 /ORGANISM="Pseudo-nitzschia pungens, Strain cf. cingulata" /LENGTH=347 /DNA_ID=CAMNT_0013088391 /DNA_START=298 /DNA_END=1342 /DNA_ORIENTATION=+
MVPMTIVQTIGYFGRPAGRQTDKQHPFDSAVLPSQEVGRGVLVALPQSRNESSRIASHRIAVVVRDSVSYCRIASHRFASFRIVSYPFVSFRILSSSVVVPRRIPLLFPPPRKCSERGKQNNNNNNNNNNNGNDNDNDNDNGNGNGNGNDETIRNDEWMDGWKKYLLGHQQAVQCRCRLGEIGREHGVQEVRFVGRASEDAVLDRLAEVLGSVELASVRNLQLALEFLSVDHGSHHVVEEIEGSLGPLDLEELGLGRSVGQNVVQERDGVGEEHVEEIAVLRGQLEHVLVPGGGNDDADLDGDADVVLDAVEFLREAVEVETRGRHLDELDLGQEGFLLQVGVVVFR